MDAATADPPAPPVDPELAVLVDVVRAVSGAERVEVEVPPAGRSAASGVPAAESAAAPVAFDVTGDDGSLAVLRVYGSTPDRLREVLPDAAALLAVLAARARGAALERAWVGRLGHDLKTPLTAVLGFAGLLGGGGVAAAGPDLVAAARRVTEAGERLLADLEADLTRWRQPLG